MPSFWTTLVKCVFLLFPLEISSRISISIIHQYLFNASFSMRYSHSDAFISRYYRSLETTSTSKESVVYRVDNVFDESCSNLDVYNKTTSKIVKSVLDGFNGTVFAYGQTSSGKTHTMHGEIGTEPGIVPLAVQDVFDSIEKCPEREFRVRVSYLEIYNENLLDLLARSSAEMDEHGQVSKTLRIQEDPERGIVVNGLKEERVQNVAQVQKVLEIGQNNRHVGATNMNARSSRSHVIFRLCIESKLRKDSELDSSDKSGHAKKPDGFVGAGTKSGIEKGGGDEDKTRRKLWREPLKQIADLENQEKRDALATSLVPLAKFFFSLSEENNATTTATTAAATTTIQTTTTFDEPPKANEYDFVTRDVSLSTPRGKFDVYKMRNSSSILLYSCNPKKKESLLLRKENMATFAVLPTEDSNGTQYLVVSLKEEVTLPSVKNGIKAIVWQSRAQLSAAEKKLKVT